MKFFKKNQKGTAIFTVICVMTILIMMVMFTLMLVGVAQTRSTVNYYNSQSYVSAKTVLDTYTTYLTADDTSKYIDIAQGGIGVTNKGLLRTQLKNLTVDTTKWYVISSNALDTTSNPELAGMGTAKIEVKKESANTFLFRVTARTGNTSTGYSDATVTKRINLVPEMGMGLFDNALISMSDLNNGAANSIIFGGSVSLQDTGTTKYQAGTIIVGDAYYSNNFELNKNAFVLGQQVKKKADGTEYYEVDTFEVKGNLIMTSNAGECKFINNTDATLIMDPLNASKLAKGNRPYILIGGDWTVSSTTGSGVIVGGSIDTSKTNQYNNAFSDTFGQPIDVYVLGNLNYSGNCGLKINGNLYVGGKIIGSDLNKIVATNGTGLSITGNNLPNVTDADKATILSLFGKDFSKFKKASYKDVPTFMTDPLPDGTVPQALMNSAIAASTNATVTMAPGATTTITDSCNLTGNMDGSTLIIDVSGRKKSTGGLDLWVKIPGGYNFNNQCNIYINNGIVPIGDRVNVYFYTDNDGKTITLDNDFIGLEKRTGSGSSFADIITQWCQYSDFKTAPHHIGTYLNGTTMETPSNLFWIIHKGTVNINNQGLFKGYIYAPNTQMNIIKSNGVDTVFYDKKQYNVNGKSTVIVGSVIGDLIAGAFNDAAPLYVKPNNSLFDAADTTAEPKWTDTKIYNNN